MFDFFNTVAVAFIVALALYELLQLAEANWFVLNVDRRVVWNPIVERVQVNPKLPARTAELARVMAWARYSRRSVLFHQLNAMQFSDVQVQFKTWPYFGMGLMGAVLFTAAGLPGLTALGIGVCGGLVTFASKQGRDLLIFSDDMAQLDDEIRNASLYARQLASACK